MVNDLIEEVLLDNREPSSAQHAQEPINFINNTCMLANHSMSLYFYLLLIVEIKCNCRDQFHTLSKRQPFLMYFLLIIWDPGAIAEIKLIHS